MNKKNDLWYVFTINNEVVPQIKTFVSGGGKKGEIQENNIQNMVKELHLDNKRQFLEYIECTYKNDAYIESLRQKEIRT